MNPSIPGKIIDVSIDEHGVRMARADFAGSVQAVCLKYTPAVVPGDYIRAHAGFALAKIDPADAARAYAVRLEANKVDELEPAEVGDYEEFEPPSSA